MAISPIILNTRFGFGIRPGARNMGSISDALKGLKEADPLDRRFARPDMMARIGLQQRIRKAKQDEKNRVRGAEARVKEFTQENRKLIGEDMRDYFARAAISNHGFKERLVAFWLDHFTVAGKNQQVLLSLGAYIDEAIRPNVATSFGEMLKAVVTHPAMLLYLDQSASFGPNSKVAQRGKRGLNENLAREILELHTLGVDGSYSQEDVRQFAELLTGLRVGEKGFFFDERAAEPGAETILGGIYGGATAKLSDIAGFLDDLAVHPDTAAHIARKLAVHFISEQPPQGLVDALTKTYRATDGDFMAVYKTLLEHPESANPMGAKAKWPTEFVISAVRALDISEDFSALTSREIRNSMQLPVQSMGMNIFRPSGPDGWSEAAADWITPPTLAARIEWAVEAAKAHGQDKDPRQMLQDVLGDTASNELQVAVAGAESKWEGVALLLVSPEFNRR